jgi:hypothetical protein
MNASIHPSLRTHVFTCVHCIVVDRTCVSNVPLDRTSKKNSDDTFVYLFARRQFELAI